ncbi:MAG: hypothetical protein SFW64_07350 [Alphaproteobacteria bacterium]|nr:hypothetical protein [Alphaproteobacteria bacterium]
MEKDKDKNKTSILEYRGDSPRLAALKSFTTSTALWLAGFVALDAAIGRAFDKNFFKNNHFPYSGKIGFGINIVLATFGGLWDANAAYKKASAAEGRHTKLVADNIAMRVADEVGKGKIADSSLALEESKTPPSYVARLETEKAAANTQAALAKL